jgi:hypothetical protein
MKTPVPITMTVFVAIIATVVITPSIAWGHTAAYWEGYNQGKRDREVNHVYEPPADMCASADLTGKDADHCIAGYNDGWNGVQP